MGKLALKIHFLSKDNENFSGEKTNHLEYVCQLIDYLDIAILRENKPLKLLRQEMGDKKTGRTDISFYVDFEDEEESVQEHEQHSYLFPPANTLNELDDNTQPNYYS